MDREHDVVVIGAGFAGLYAVHKFRDQLGLRVQGFEAADGPGGTWWWNRYPGARCDFESVHYSYSFSADLQREWEWTERFAAQPEILSYLEWVADRLDVRRSFRFSTKVAGLTWDEARARWSVALDDGSHCTARFVVTCVGNLSVPKEPEFPGAENFAGEIYQTSRWPHDDVDFRGKRVGVVGTGSTGIQLIPEIARQAAHLTVFQRTPNFAAPLRNAVVEPAERRWNAENHAEVRRGTRDSFLGAPYPAPSGSARAASSEERRRIYDEYWAQGGFRFVASTFDDLLFDEEANATAADYIRERIRERVADPAVADLLSPRDHPYASKRPPFETDYYETFNLEHVDLVDVRSAPIERIVENGLRTTERLHELDAIVLATGFDAATGPLLALAPVGRDGQTLDAKWVDGPNTYLGLQTAGFPNLFMITGPLSAAGLYNNPLAIEDHLDFLGELLHHALERGARTIEASPEAENRWGALCTGLLNHTVIPKAKSSWYMGANIPGKPRATYLFAGGAPLYRAITAEVADRDYAGFAIDGHETRIPPMVKLDPSVALALGAMLLQKVKPLDQCTLEESRAMIDSLAALQAPGPETRVTNLQDPRGRLYRPEGTGPFPVVVHCHGGGWVAGSVDLADAFCRRVAVEAGVMVLSVDYRLAPEHPFPAAPDDVLEALRWARSHVAEFGGDPERLAIMGDSAGGNLAAATALRARDSGIRLSGQVLVYPALDPDASTPSRTEFVDGPFVSVAAGEQMWHSYLRGAEVTPLAAPLRAESLADLAPALVLTVECDPLRDEGEDYADALAAAAVPVVRRRFDGLVHGVLDMSAVVPRVAEMHGAISTFLGEIFGSGDASRPDREAVSAKG